MAGKKQPIELVVANGKKHLTKAEIEQRKSTEVKANSDKIKPPTHLTKEEKKQFKKISKELIDIGIMGNVDCEILAMYVESLTEYNKNSAELKQLNPRKNYEDYNKIAIEKDRCIKQCRGFASDMGLTISSRCRLVLPKPTEKEKKNKFSKFAK
ncbi:MAG: phage terminase small subunit P27 family [Paraclostridium sordellii]|uniref:phage terminase small subunit P27 family n=1 Tax=Paraclostridium sordellii TaxID=1505 RepID=UPI0005E435B0|nr:phage terminase small subunit P27 family [Paeniclostridium sordellii]MDU6115218.1 phage terminase small subunit P27 family [Paeniclostridium sordellii]CEP41669.1 phage terminase [[Clostridium] sordellii] [Paeniclostridium sordellii]